MASVVAWAVVRGRPARAPRWVPLVLGWLGSGALFAWSGWKLPFVVYLALVRPADVALPEGLAFAAILHLAAVGSGAAMRELSDAIGCGARALRQFDVGVPMCTTRAHAGGASGT
ncbi:hypothetical protein [Streptomyces sp. NPDC048057]|uniref:hypothetical protein n=1 Tax=Streptomyces sp. NPDC048057 TaxID=3155628 RepID=UPI0034086E84